MKKLDLNKRIKILILIILLSIVLIALFLRAINTYAISRKNGESLLSFQTENSETIFSIDKITYFSSANAKIETNSNSSFAISDLFQYTDIAIFINPHSELLNSKNTLKTVVLSDISFSSLPSIGTPSLYYKNLLEFASPKFSKENVIDKTITFDTTSENTIDYSNPVLYNNCANPITLCYINSNLQKEYTLSNEVSNISNNGSLLQKCGITLNSISCKVSFNITIINNLDETYTCPITLNIPLSTECNTVYDGSLILKDSTNYRFIKSKHSMWM